VTCEGNLGHTYSFLPTGNLGLLICARCVLRGYLRCRWFRARVDRTVKSVREETSLLNTRFTSKRKAKHLSSRPSCAQPIADFDRKSLPCVSTGRRNKVHTVHSLGPYLQSRNLCSYSSSMFCLSP